MVEIVAVVVGLVTLTAVVRAGSRRLGVPDPIAGRAGLLGAAAMVIDELLAPACLVRWLEDGSPVGRVDLV